MNTNPTRVKISIAALMLVVASLGIGVWWYLQADMRQPPRSLKVQIDWLHGPDFTGLYVAQANGYYKDQGLAVTLREGGIKIDPVKTVVDGTADIGMASGHHLVKSRSQGAAVTAVACLLQQSPLALASLENLNITSPKELAGKIIRSSPQNVPVIKALLRQVGGDDNFTIVQTHDLNALYSGKVDVWAGYITGAIKKAASEGYPLNIILPQDYDVFSYHECVFVRDDFMQDNSREIAGFLAATFKGWDFAFERSAEAVKKTVERYGDVEQQVVLDYIASNRALIKTGDTQIGWMSAETWSSMKSTLIAAEEIQADFDESQMYTMRYLRLAYQ